YLVATLAFRLVLVVIRALLAPGSAPLRIAPMSDDAAHFWYHRLALIAGWFLFGWATADALGRLGVSIAIDQLVAYKRGIGFLALAVEASWHRPEPSTEPPGADEQPAKRSLGAWLRSGYFIALWVLWVASALPIFWLAVFTVALPVALGFSRRAIDHLLR